MAVTVAAAAPAGPAILRRAAVDDDVLNMSLRKFLKKVGVTSQREIENAVKAALASGRLKGDERLKAEVRLTIAEAGLDTTIDGEIELA